MVGTRAQQCAGQVITLGWICAPIFVGCSRNWMKIEISLWKTIANDGKITDIYVISV